MMHMGNLKNDCIDFTGDHRVIADWQDFFAVEFTRGSDTDSYRITNVAIKIFSFWPFQINRLQI